MKKKEEKAAKAKAEASSSSTGKRKATKPADDGETGAVAETELEKVEKPKTRQRRKKDQDKVEEDASVEAVAPSKTKRASKSSEVKPKAKSQSKAKAKEPKAKVSEPKAKAKRAAKAKAKGKTKKPETDEESQHSEGETPRKQLFQSQDDGSDHSGDESEHERLDAKTGKVEPLREILERCEVDKHKAKNRKQETPEPVEETPKKAKGGKNKGKKTKVDLSPFTKKEVARRKRKDKEVMQSEAKEDGQIQAIVRQHLKNVEKLTYEEVKVYLRKHLTNRNAAEFRLNEYWGRPACGVKVLPLGDGTVKKAPEVVYIGKYGTCPEGWNYNMACVYVTASLMASRFDPYGASWMEDLPWTDVEDHANPTGKISTHAFFVKYNVSVAAASFRAALTKK
eukprot:s55_g26.t1